MKARNLVAKHSRQFNKAKTFLTKVDKQRLGKTKHKKCLTDYRRMI